MRAETRRSVVQPALALAVHVGVISLALGSPPATEPDRPVDPAPGIVYLPTPPAAAPLTGVADGTGLPVPVSVPITMPTQLPPLIPGSITVPLSRPGSFDPRAALIEIRDTVDPGLGVLTERDLTDPPRALHFGEPRYPEALRKAGFAGMVSVTYIVDAEGTVEPPSIRIVSSDHPAFSEAVLAVLGEAQFTPGRVRGRAVRVLVRQTIRFATRP